MKEKPSDETTINEAQPDRKFANIALIRIDKPKSPLPNAKVIEKPIDILKK